MIHLSEPVFLGNELAYVKQALAARQLSRGPFVARLETVFAEHIGVAGALACSSGTAALHLMLLALGVAPGDEVIVPDLTYIATANAVTYCGARPIFVDVLPDTWCIDPQQARTAISARTVGILAVHLYGAPAQMDELADIAADADLWLAEDAAEAIGTHFHSKRAGALGRAAAFSFFGSKTLTCGEGGMLVSDDLDLLARARVLHGQGVAPGRHYHHIALGYNYRLGELQGAVALAQVERAAEHILYRDWLARWYHDLMPADAGIWQGTPPSGEHGHWMNVLRCNPERAEAAVIAARLRAAGFETRPAFVPLHQQPVYRGDWRNSRFPTADAVSAWGLCLPSHGNVTYDDVKAICQTVAGGSA